MAATRPSQLAEQAAKSLKRVVADNSPQETPKRPTGPAALSKFVQKRRW
jgi:hypothetical protein